MSLLKIFSARLHGLLRREAVIQDMAEEMRLHLEMAPLHALSPAPAAAASFPDQRVVASF
jgi:hypothetical protein